MTPHRDESPLTSFPWRSALAAALAVSLLVGLPAFTDDTNLLRFDTAKPYVFIILDTSASMGMAFEDKNDVWTPGGADGPGSRLYQAKQALFNTFSEVNDVHFGFASFNQDEVRAYEKHWLYYLEEDIQADNSWPIPFPLRDWDSTVDPDATDATADDGDSSALTQLVAITTVADDGTTITGDRDTRELEIDGHLLTFGSAFDLASAGLGVNRNAGTCNDPLNFNDDADLRKLQSFAIDGGGAPPTQMWLTDGSNNDYLLEVWQATTDLNDIGEDNIQVELRLSSYSSCTSDSQAADGGVIAEETVQMRLDPYLGEHFVIDSTEGTISDGTNNQGIETLPEMWEHQDAVSDASFGDRPFTGKGWESNYDSGGTVAAIQTELDGSESDRWCAAGSLSAEGTCPRDLFLSEVKPVEDTIFDNQDRRSLDFGDMIPFHWSESLNRRADLLDRLAPGYSSLSEPDFRGASFFGDSVGVLSDDDKATFGTPNLPLQLKNSSNRPLLALDNSPLARAINDMRCWYLGNRGQGANKCDSDNPVVDTGWEEAACEFDSQFGCRKPYLIIISDGEDNVSGENASADVGDLQGASGVRTWVLNLGDPKNCASGELNSIVNAGGTGKGSTGECIDVAGGGDLREELESILGEIRTEVRAFASAAVPTVQATVEQKIFLTNFTPFNDSGVWDGHIDSFLKPLPVDDGTGKPDESKKCGDTYVDEAGETRVRVTRCFLWDAGDNLHNLQYDNTLTSDQLLDETDPALRRVFYAQQATEPGQWANNRRLLNQPELVKDADEVVTDPVSLDLWEAFGISTTFNSSGDYTAQYESKYNRAEEIIDFVLHEKSGTELNSATGTKTIIDFLLGDIFHSTPQVVGTPPNLFYFARDLNGEDGGACEASPADNKNKGYRCFFNRHRLRRKMLLVGSNDGQLHVFDAGRFRGHDDTGATDHFTGLDLVNDANPDGSFDNGTGMELFSYVPRMVMPTLNLQETTPSQHFFTVDGNFTVADVFVDPVAESESTFPDEAQREWRTVVVGGLREGGAGYYALDITQPDVIDDHTELGFVPHVPSSDTNDPTSANYIPGCMDATTEGCSKPAFPAVAWEFTDRVYDEDTSSWYYVDEDEDWMKDSDSPHTGGVPQTDPSFEKSDLGDSWSTPNIGRIQVCTGSDCAPGGADVEDRYVAVFGGGMDVDSKVDPTNEVRGNWLYMVDIETGQAIYKQRLTGAAPAEPASVDLNGDGYFDRIYIGTLAGLLYRVDVGLVDGSVPALTPLEVTAIDDPENPSTSITAEVDRIPRDAWVPTVLFNANFDIGFNDDGTPIVDSNGDLADQDANNFRPIYYRPAVIFQADDEGFVLAFGTGDREDLWSLEPVTGRFFTLVDSFASTADISTALNESDLARVGVGDTSNAGQNFLETGGWYLVLNEKERVITEAFSLSGLTIFSAYEPIIFTGDDATAEEEADTEEERVCGEDIEGVEDDTVCSLRGNSNIYVVKTTNADGLLFDSTGAAQRSKQVADFVTNPFTEQGTVKRSEGDGSDAEGDDGGSADELTPDLEKVMDSLKELFPDQCRFANYRVDVKTIAADTSLQFIAPIPVCIIEHNWKEY